jgi:hypothetical protein
MISTTLEHDPDEAIHELRVITSNADATCGRASGAEVGHDRTVCDVAVRVRSIVITLGVFPR